MLNLSAQENNNLGILLTRQNIVMLLSAITIAVLYDGLFFGKFAGVSYPIFVCCLCMILYKNIKPRIVKKWSFGWFLGLPIGALSLTYLFFSNEVLRTLNSLFIPVLIIAHMLLISENNWYAWFQWRFLKDILNGLIVRPFKHNRELGLLIIGLIQEREGSAKHAILKKVVIGGLLFVPVLIVIILLLSSADLIFQHLLYKIFDNIRLEEVMKHILLIGCITLIAFSYLWGLINGRPTQEAPQNPAKKLDVVIILTGLFLLNIVYGLFSCIQFPYFFGSVSNLLPEGLSYAEYARRGFFELIVVALINLAIVLSSLNFTKISGVFSDRLFKGLNSALLISTFILLLSAHFRMSLYEEVYGCTYLRVFTHAFMGMIFLILSITLCRIWCDRINLAKWYITIGLISYVLINYLNVDVFIAQRNMARYYNTGNIDVYYLAGMSYDTLPYLGVLAKEANKPIALEASKAISQKRQELSVVEKWQSYNLSKEKAKAYLAKN